MHLSGLCRVGLAILFAGLAGYRQKNQPPAVEFDPQTARGTITGVTCLEDPTQSYAVYLPSNYTSERRWPIIYAFDPFARGETAVKVYEDAAEKYGYIVAGSNNSRNGPSAAELAAAQALWQDTHHRFAINKDRVYATGLSGGARAATAFALYCYTCDVAGVIAHGAGYPTLQKGMPPANNHFVYYVAIGDEDFNYPEIMALRKKKDEAGTACKVKIYPGPHQWAPPPIAEDAIEWVELKAMQAGTEKVDPAFVRVIFERTKAEATQAEENGDALTEYYALRSLVVDFKGLEETAGFNLKVASVKSSKVFKKAQHNQQNDIAEQVSLTSDAEGLLGQFESADANSQAAIGRQITSAMSDLRRRAKSTSSDHLVCARAFTQLWVQILEAGQDAFRENQLSQAAAHYELLVEASPDQAWPLLLLAEARVRAGNKKAALQAIEQALQRGLKNAQTLTQDPELQPLASDPDFQRIVRSLNTQ